MIGLLLGSGMLVSLIGSAAGFAVEPYKVESFLMSELRNGLASDRFARVLQSTGLIAIQPDDSYELERLRELGLNGVCKCWSNHGDRKQDFRSVEGSDSGLLRDGATVRTTLATATIGQTPLPLPSSLHEICDQDLLPTLELLRDQVAMASDVFISALDRLVFGTARVASGTAAPCLLRDKDGSVYSTIKSIVSKSTNLEHFHLYAKDKEALSREADPLNTLDFHTDAGLFLAFLPAQHCQVYNNNVVFEEEEEEEDQSFYLQDVDGIVRRAVFPRGSIAVMLGEGAQHWLQTSMDLQATRHAVRMQPGDTRAWYGMMYLVPRTAVIQESPDYTFDDMRTSMALTRERRLRRYGDDLNEEYEVPSIGCGLSDSRNALTIKGSSSSRKRLQMVDDASFCNNSTNFFCWMSCLNIPEADKAQGYINEGYSLYCLDPSILASSGNRVSKAVEPCLDGAVHNDRCMGSWQPTAPGVPAQEVIINGATNRNRVEPFCYGGTSMYMNGFQWLGPTCAIYLFPNWILDTAGKLIVACLGSILFGCIMEYLIRHRRDTIPTLPPGWKRLGVSALAYGAQLSMGYSLMLVVMIYSGPLFLSVILGLVFGHVLFNAKDALLTAKEEVSQVATEDAEHCPCFMEPEAEALGKHDSEERDDYGSCCPPNVRIESTNPTTSATDKSVKMKADNKKSNVSEGATPCCQHML